MEEDRRQAVELVEQMMSAHRNRWGCAKIAEQHVSWPRSPGYNGTSVPELSPGPTGALPIGNGGKHSCRAAAG